MLEKQNVTLSIPKDILKKAKHMAVDQQTSLSGLLSKTLVNIVRKEEEYSTAKAGQLAAMEKGFDLGLNGKITWKRDSLHDKC